MANDLDKLAEAINRLAEAQEVGLKDVATSIEFVGQQIGALSDPDNGLAFESYSELKSDITDAIRELTDVLKPKDEPKSSKPKAKSN
jgi:predicted transcriptional regulator